MDKHTQTPNKRASFGQWKHWMTYARWMMVGIVLLVLILVVAGFVARWSPMVLHPAEVLDAYPEITNDIFSILVIYEIFDLLYTLSPTRLMDVVLLTIARKIVLSHDQSGLIESVVAFSLLLAVRLAWDRFSRHADDTRS